MIFRTRQFPKVKLLYKIGEVGKINHLLMVFSLGNK